MPAAHVRVTLKDGCPCLQVIDADSHTVRMAWSPPRDGECFDQLGLRNFCRECLLQQAAAAWWSEGCLPRK